MARKQLYFVLHQVTTYEHEQQQQLSMLHANLKFRFLYLVDISCVLSPIEILLFFWLINMQLGRAARALRRTRRRIRERKREKALLARSISYDYVTD